MANTLDQTQIDANIDVNAVIDGNMDLMTPVDPNVDERKQDEEFHVSFSTGDNKKNRKNNRRR